MMINKRLIGTVGESKKYIAGNVAAQWCSLAANIAMMTAIPPTETLGRSIRTATADIKRSEREMRGKLRYGVFVGAACRKREAGLK